MNLPFIDQQQNTRRAQTAPTKPIFAKKKSTSPQSHFYSHDTYNLHNSTLLKPSLNNEDDSLVIGYELQNSAWKQKKRDIEKRSRGWLARFGADIDESIVHAPPLTKTELKEQQIIASGWVNTPLKGVHIPEPRQNIPLSKMLNYNASHGHHVHPVNTYCYVCWKMVPLGSSLVQCLKCPLVSHLECIEHKERFLKNKADFSSPVSNDKNKSGHTVGFKSPTTTGTGKISYAESIKQALHNVEHAEEPPETHLVPIRLTHSKSSKSITVVQFDLSTNSIVTKTTKRTSFEMENEVDGYGGGSGASGGLTRSPPTPTGKQIKQLPTGNKQKSPSPLKTSKSSRNLHQYNDDDDDNTSPSHHSGSFSAVPKRHRKKSMTEIALTDDCTSADIEWICPFCISDLAFINNYNKQKHNKLLLEMIKLTSCIKLQAFIRMTPKRIRFWRLKRGFVLLQQQYRMNAAALREETEKANMRFPFRIRLHEIHMFVKIDSNPHHEMYNNTSDGVHSGHSSTATSVSRYACSDMLSTPSSAVVSSVEGSGSRNTSATPNSRQSVKQLAQKSPIKPFQSPNKSRDLPLAAQRTGQLQVNSSKAPSDQSTRERTSSTTGSMESNLSSLNAHGQCQKQIHSVTAQMQSSLNRSQTPYASGYNSNNTTQLMPFPSLPGLHVIGELSSMGYDKLFYYNNSPANATPAVTATVPDKHAVTVALMTAPLHGPSSHGKLHSGPGHKARLAVLQKEQALTADESDQSPEGSPAKDNIGGVSQSTSPTASTVATAMTTGNGGTEGDMAQLLLTNHQDAPQYMKSHRSLQIIPKNTLFLTISVHENPLGADEHARRSVQLMRYDVPLKQVGKAVKITRSALANLGYQQMDSSLFNNIQNNYKMITFVPAKPYVFFPYCRANADVKLTVSQVSDWPKSIFVGQAVYNVKHNVLRKRSVSLNQNVNYACIFSDIPTQEEGGKLNLVQKFLQKPIKAPPGTGHHLFESTSSGGSGVRSGVGSVTALRSVTSSMSSSSSSGVPITGSDRTSIAMAKKEQLIEYAHGITTYSILTMGYSEFNDYGFIDMHNQETIKSTSKKCWCVLIDRVLMVYTCVKDSVKPRSTIDLKQATVSLLADEIIKVKTVTDTIFLHCLALKDCEKWFRKLYSQSLSHTTTPYHTYIRRRPSFEFTSYSGINAINTGGETGEPNDDKRNTNKSGNHHQSLASTRPKPRRRTSMEEVELLEYEIESFISRMKTDFINVTAQELLTQHNRQVEDEVRASGTNYRNLRIDGNSKNSSELLTTLHNAVATKRL